MSSREFREQFARGGMAWAEHQFGVKGTWKEPNYDSPAYQYPSRMFPIEGANVLKIETFSPNGNYQIAQYYVVVIDGKAVGCTCRRAIARCTHMDMAEEAE